MGRALTLVAIVVVVAAGWIYLLPPAPVRQPLAFNHARHAQMGCAVCHQGVGTAARAGIAQGEICVKCHTTAPRVAGAAALWGRVGRGEPIGWVRATRLPDEALFSHRRHVTLGKLECASCHADVGKRTAPPGVVPVRLNMDACLSCHQREGASQDCAACHR